MQRFNYLNWIWFVLKFFRIFQLALMNRKLNPRVETIFMMPKDTYTFVSSRLVKEIARLGGDVGQFVPPVIEKALRDRLNLKT